MSTFYEFLQEKTRGTDWKERRNRREEWLGALDRLYAQIRGYLKESDPDGILEIIKYEVERVESRLGVYDAPALRIRVATESVNIVPVGLHVPNKPLSLMNLLAIPANKSRWGDLSSGWVDVTDGERRHMLFRSTDGGRERWYVLMTNKTGDLPELSRESLEEVLQDLLS